jgi:hypothetical protein
MVLLLQLAVTDRDCQEFAKTYVETFNALLNFMTAAASTVRARTRGGGGKRAAIRICVLICRRMPASS